MARRYKHFILPAITLLVVLKACESAQPAVNQPAPSSQKAVPNKQQQLSRDAAAQPPPPAAAAAGASEAQQPASRHLLQAPNRRPPSCAKPAGTKEPVSAGTPFPRLATNEKPNFIVILTDDQGWDDIGFNNPKYIKTPNLDKFITEGVLFDNFYTSPQCAQTRASLLTGRHHPRSSTMMVHGGYDFIHTDEATAGEIMSELGYSTLHVGKWHQNDVQGYAPSDVGFQHSWHTTVMNPECLMSYNGTYVENESASGAVTMAEPDASAEMASRNGFEYRQTTLMDKLIGFLKLRRTGNTADAERPFFIYYPPHAIHKVGDLPDGKIRVYPRLYLDKLLSDPAYQGIALSTLDAWANLAYLDDLLGRLFQELEKGGVAEHTYVFIMSDNGPSLQTDENRSQETIKVRKPSMMQGAKSTLFEGGIRNFLAVRGPGVTSGAIDSTLLHITDILPTIMDLAGVPHDTVYSLPFDGISFRNLLHPVVERRRAALKGRRGSALASDRQSGRFLVEMSATCWDSDAVPELNADRQVLKPQRLLDYGEGGLLNSVFGTRNYFPAGVPIPPRDAPGFKLCMAVRYQDYKWLGLTGKVYRLTNGSHVELPCNEVKGLEGRRLAKQLASAAQRWFDSLVAEPHSFTKPMFYLGLETWTVSNIIAEGAHERTPGSIKLFANGASGFRDLGDRMCFKVEVLQESTHDVVVLYTSNLEVIGTFKLSVGPYADIMNGTAPSVTATLPVSDMMQGYTMGQLRNIAKTPIGVRTEACLELVNTTSPGTSVFKHLAVIRLIRRRDLEQNSTDIGVTAQAAAAASGISALASSVNAIPTATIAPEPVMNSRRVDVAGPGGSTWKSVRLACGWPAGQAVLENMYNPYFAEGIEKCARCKPRV